MLFGGFIPAAGHGNVLYKNVKTSKLVVPVHGKPVIDYVVDSLQGALTKHVPIVVVKNHLYGEAVVTALRSCDHDDLILVTDPWGLGTAGALAFAIPALKMLGVDAAVTIFADMLCVKSETIGKLVSVHEEKQPAITMLTVPVRKEHRLAKYFAKYGLVKYDGRGKPCGTHERRKIKGTADLSDGEIVNPSVFVIDLAWAEKSLHYVKRKAKLGGHPDEYHLPSLLEVASEQLADVEEVRLEIPEQALQVNEPEDWPVVEQVLKGRGLAATAS